jgi:hypothetical protein
LCEASGYWVIIDRLWALHPTGRDASFRLHWQLAPGEVQLNGNAAVLDSKGRRFFLTSLCNLSGHELSLSIGREEPSGFDGWHSRYYNYREPVPAINVVAKSSNECWFASAYGSSIAAIEFDDQNTYLRLNEATLISLDILHSQAPKMLEELMN